MINRRASEMLDEWVPVPCMKDSAEAVSLLDRRESLAAYLGLTSSLRESLTTTFVVALPLLSAFLSSLIGAKVTV